MMTTAQRLTIKASEERSRLNELSGLETLTDEQRTEIDTLSAEYADTERQLRAAIAAEPDPAVETHQTPDGEDRERLALRSRATLGGYLLARMQGRLPAGELAEYQAACGVEDGIPLDLFESDRPAVEVHADAATPSPAAGSGAGLNIGRILPAVFDQSIARRLGIAMPTVGTGTWSEMVISTPLTAAAKAKGGAVEATAAALTPVSANPRRISARLSIQAEDAAQIGTPRFESALRANLSEALSDEYHKQCINGDGTAPSVNGLLKQLDNPTAPTDVVTWDSFLSTVAAFTGSKYAETMSDLSVIVPPDAYRLSTTTFRDKTIDTGQRGGVSLGSVSAQRYLSDVLGGWSTATRLPVAPTSGGRAKISTGIVRRTGRGMDGAAVHPVWSSLSIDDVYTGSAAATRHVSLHVLVGDKVMLVRPKGEIFDKVSFKVAA